MTLAVAQVEDLVTRPVEVVREICNLLVEAILGVARYTPPNEPKSKSNSPLQCGQEVWTSAEPSSLIRR